MPRKGKPKHSAKSSGGVGYVSVVCLIAAALLIGSTHKPLKELLETLFDASRAVETASAKREQPAEISASISEKPQDIELLIPSNAGLTVLKVTVSDSTRIEYLLESASVGVDASHKKAVLALTCAMRKAGPVRRSVVFVGVGRYRDSVGQLAMRSRAETKLSALRINRINCDRELSERDVSWNEIVVYDIRFAIPRGFKVDI